MIKRLYIIGNGFDLYHGIPSCYSRFHEWLENNRKWDYDDVESHFGCVDLWASLEENMAKFQYENFAKGRVSPVVNECLSIRGCDRPKDEVVKLDDTRLSQWHSEVMKGLREWTKTLVRADKSRLISLDEEDAVFLTFNYTLTLERDYAIENTRILHIHGSIDEKDGGVLQLGHGGKISMPAQGSKDCVQDEVFCLDEFLRKDSFDNFQSWRKPVEENIAKQDKFWSGLRDVGRVCVLGFPFGDVDMPYIEKIVSVVSPDAEWFVTWYKEKERTELPAALRRCGVKNVKPIKWDSLKVMKTC